MVREFFKGIPAARRAVHAVRRTRRRVLLRREGEAALHRAFAEIHGRPVDVESPTYFTERMMAWLIRLHRRPDRRFSMLADKVASREYVRERLGADFLTRLYWHGDDPHGVPWETLPERFVIKPTHSSGEVIVADRALDRGWAVGEMARWLQSNYYWGCREYQYLHIPPRLMVEEWIDDGTEGGPFDYSFWCFNGVPELIQLRKHPRVVNQFHDLDWNLLPLKARPGIPEVDFGPPPSLEEMTKAAARLAEGLEYVRVDFYSLPGRILFSEFTFTPAAGRTRFEPPGWDAKLGAMWGRGSEPNRGGASVP